MSEKDLDAYDAAYWLEKAREKIGDISDSELARHLHCSRQAISQQRSGKTAMSVISSIKVADILGIDPMLILAYQMYKQSVKADDTEYWRDRIMKFKNKDKLMIAIEEDTITRTSSSNSVSANSRKVSKKRSAGNKKAKNE
jgi:plasmid maintenance system antidote protein VapI